MNVSCVLSVSVTFIVHCLEIQCSISNKWFCNFADARTDNVFLWYTCIVSMFSTLYCEGSSKESYVRPLYHTLSKAWEKLKNIALMVGYFLILFSILRVVWIVIFWRFLKTLAADLPIEGHLCKILIWFRNHNYFGILS